MLTITRRSLAASEASSAADPHAAERNDDPAAGEGGIDTAPGTQGCGARYAGCTGGGTACYGSSGHRMN